MNNLEYIALDSASQTKIQSLSKSILVSFYEKCLPLAKLQ